MENLCTLTFDINDTFIVKRPVKIHNVGAYWEDDYQGKFSELPPEIQELVAVLMAVDTYCVVDRYIEGDKYIEGLGALMKFSTWDGIYVYPGLYRNE